jgi:hypothetical protein
MVAALKAALVAQAAVWAAMLAGEALREMVAMVAAEVACTQVSP